MSTVGQGETATLTVDGGDLTTDATLALIRPDRTSAGTINATTGDDGVTWTAPVEPYNMAGLWWHVWTVTGTGQGVAEIPVSVDTPYVIEGRLAGGILYCRLNGGTEQQIASGNIASLSDSLRFGRNDSGGAFLDGKISEVAIFNAVPNLSLRAQLVTNFRNWIGA